MRKMGLARPGQTVPCPREDIPIERNTSAGLITATGPKREREISP